MLPKSSLRLGQWMLQAWPVSDDKIGLEYKVKRLLAGSLMSPARGHVYWNGTFSDQEKRRLVGERLPRALDQILLEHGSKLADANGNLDPYLWFDQKYYLADDILVKSDRISMAHSVEVRPPFLDHRIVEFASRIPASLKISGSRQKIVSATSDERQASEISVAAAEGRFRYPGARLAARTAARAVGRDFARRRRGIF